MDWSLPGSLVHGILQARTLEWVAISFSKGSSWPRDWTLVSCIPGRFFIIWTTRAKSQLLLRYFLTLRYYDSDKFVDISIIIQRLKAGGEGENRGWHGWMASLTRWTWVWASSGSWWWTGKPGVLQSMESQRVGHDWAAELNWTIIQRSVVTWRLGVDKLFFFFFFCKEPVGKYFRLSWLLVRSWLHIILFHQKEWFFTLWKWEKCF